ncbi:MAG TPA: EpsI family protein [Longimicrobiales bacterium]|nr:EpsI family protein [Longimicrobiales bacterium]
MTSPRVLWALFALTLLLFLPTLASFADVWDAQPYTHGYLLALAVVWLLWRDRDTLREADVPWPQAAALAAGLSLFWFGAHVARARMPEQALLPLLLLLWCGAVFGRASVRRLWPAAAVFLLAVPVWGAITRPLQTLTVLMSGGGARLLGIPARIEGDYIHIASGTFLVEGGCAGLNYLMSGLTVGSLYALVIPMTRRGQAAIVGLAAVLAMVGNWVRVGGLVVLGELTDMQSIFITESRPHLVYGWSIFFAGLLAFFPLARRIAERTRAPRRAATLDAATTSDPVAPAAPPGATSTAAATVEAAAPFRLRAAGLATLAAALGPVLFYAFAFLPPHEPAPWELREIPERWTALAGSRQRPRSWMPSFPGADVMASTAWTDGTHRVLVDRFIYLDQAQGAELIGYTSRIAPEGDVLAQLGIGLVGPRRRVVNVAIVRDPAAPLLVWYWYRVGGVETASAAKAKLLEIWAFLTRSIGSELIAVSAPCEPNDCTAAAGVLGDFFGGST